MRSTHRQQQTKQPLGLEMTSPDAEQHALIARRFLEASDKEFEEGDILQACEKLWGAARHTLKYASLVRDWSNGTTTAIRHAAHQLAEEVEDPRILLAYKAAEKLHANFYNSFMERDEIEEERPLVRYLVARLLPDQAPMPVVDSPPAEPTDAS